MITDQEEQLKIQEISGTWLW